MKLDKQKLKAYISSNIFWGICAFVAITLCVTAYFALRSDSEFDIKKELLALTENIHKYYQKSPDYRALNSKTAIENKIIPPSMVRHHKIYSLSKSEILIGKDMKGDVLIPMDRFFSIIYLRVNKNVCLSLADADFNSNSGLIGITVQNDKTYEFTYGGELSLPISKDEVLNSCKSKNTIMFTFE